MQDVEWIKFAASDSVSELVWNQHEGLSLKSIDRSKSDKNPIILWNIWQDSSVPLSPSKSVGSNGEKQIDARNFIVSCSNSYVDKEVDQRKFPRNKDTAMEIIGPSHKQSTENSPKMEEDNNDGDSPSQKAQIDENLVDTHEDIEVCSAVNVLEAGTMADETHDIAMARKLDIGTLTNATTICNNSDGNVEHITDKKNLPSLNTLEFSGENDLHLMNRVDFLPSERRFLRGKSVPIESSSIIKTSRLQGRKKAVSEGNLKRRFMDARDDSQKSEESCNSVGFISKGKRKCEFQENLMAESKRIKRISGSRLDSSFMNWIINVAKGSSSKPNHEEAPSLDQLELEIGHSNQEHGSSSKICNSFKKNNGFQNVFKSLYTSSSKFSVAKPATDEVNLINSPELFTAESFGELNKVPDECTPLSQIDCSNCNENPKLSGEGGENNTGLISSLWITRFSTQNVSSPLNLDRGKIINSGVPSNTVDRKTSVESSYKEEELIASKNETMEEIYGHNQQNHTLPAENFRNPEAIAFMFPRKLDALKRLVPLKSKDHGTCFFCGKRRENFSDFSYNEGAGDEDTNHILPVTSIRCIQSNNVATSQIGTSKQKLLENNVCQCAGQTIKKDKNDIFFEGVHYHSSRTFFEGDCEDHLTNEKHPIAPGSPDSSEKKGLIFHQFLPVTVNDEQVGDLPKEIFDAVRRLQVSRADMHKLMNSQVLLSHIEGFFLRLRLGKWEAGLGGTGYHVACITGKSIQDGQNCLYVDVGGIKCPVGSQYVSNQEFSEEELMTWWCRSKRSGGKIPSKDDLDLKFNLRIKLGF